jgi:hypothetical protein
MAQTEHHVPFLGPTDIFVGFILPKNTFFKLVCKNVFSALETK